MKKKILRLHFGEYRVKALQPSLFVWTVSTIALLVTRTLEPVFVQIQSSAWRIPPGQKSV